MALEAFRYYLLGNSFIVATDHTPLKCLQQMKDTNARLMRCYLTLQPFAFTMQHQASKKHANVDMLS